MNKQELISQIADSAKCTKADATVMLDSLVDIITSSLKQGDDVRLTGFGTFTVAKRKETTGRNPRTGQSIKIAASTQPKFRAGKSLKDAVQ